MEIIKGQITDITESGHLTIRANYPNIDRAILREYREVQIGLPDGRYISPEQRRKSYALMGEIADWMGESPKRTKSIMKWEFIVNRLQALHKELFSLSNCDMTTAREFISFLVEFILEHGVPTRVPLYELCEDIRKYVYACLMNKKCAVCGREDVDLHHFDQVGMGNDRTNIYQIGMRVLPLCREHHTIAHAKGRSWLTDELYLTPIELTVDIGKKYGLTKKNLTCGN